MLPNFFISFALSLKEFRFNNSLITWIFMYSSCRCFFHLSFIYVDSLRLSIPSSLLSRDLFHCTRRFASSHFPISLLFSSFFIPIFFLSSFLFNEMSSHSIFIPIKHRNNSQLVHGVGREIVAWLERRGEETTNIIQVDKQSIVRNLIFIGIIFQ